MASLQPVCFEACFEAGFWLVLQSISPGTVSASAGIGTTQHCLLVVLVPLPPVAPLLLYIEHGLQHLD